MPLNFCVKPFSSLTTFQAHAMATHLGAGAGQAIEVSKRRKIRQVKPFMSDYSRQGRVYPRSTTDSA